MRFGVLRSSFCYDRRGKYALEVGGVGIVGPGIYTLVWVKNTGGMVPRDARMAATDHGHLKSKNYISCLEDLCV